MTLPKMSEAQTMTAAEFRSIAAKSAKRSKFGAKKSTVDGEGFDSQGEANYWFGVVKVRERAGEISNVRRQVLYRLEVAGHLICEYVADYAWTEAGGLPVTADFKGFVTREFKIKAKLFRALMGREIVIVRGK